MKARKLTPEQQEVKDFLDNMIEAEIKGNPVLAKEMDDLKKKTEHDDNEMAVLMTDILKDYGVPVSALRGLL